MTEVRSWINKGTNDPPEWVDGYKAGKRDPNGSFLIRTKAGKEDVQARVLPGMMVIERKGIAYTRPPAEARSLLVELDEEEKVFPPLGPALPNGGRKAAADPRPIPDRDQPGPPPPTPPSDALKPASAPTERPRYAPPKGSPPSIEFRPTTELKVDDSYQRSIDTGPSKALIEKIAREWDWRMCPPLVVSKRDDGFYVIDGQHRHAGAVRRGDILHLPCCVTTYRDAAEEAAMFVAMNRSRRAINRLDDFHAAQAGADADALAVAAMIHGVGFTVSRRTGSAAWTPGEVAFTSAIAKARRRHGEDLTSVALKLMAEAFPGQRLVVGGSIFTATVSVLADPPADFHRDRLLSALHSFDMPGWSSFLSKNRGGTDRAKDMRDVLLEAYADAGKGQAA